MEVVRTVAELRAIVDAWRSAGLASAVVPTMGGLHQGHVSLVRHGLSLVDRVVATIFVNPTQFGANEDLDNYPRDEAHDVEMLQEAGCGAIFAPALAEMYPPGFSTRVVVDGLTSVLCGAARPGHFDGVSQVVSKLLNQARCDLAVFGEKDWQQLAVVTRMARDLDIATRIVGAPTVREADGLAMSSRNRYLTGAEREIAPRLAAEMREATKRIAEGASVIKTCRDAERAVIAAGFLAVDYLEVRTADGLAPVETLDSAIPTRIFGAAHLGRARLIDNMAIA